MEAAAAVQDGGTLLVGHAQVVRGRGCDGRDGPPARGAWCVVHEVCGRRYEKPQ